MSLHGALPVSLALGMPKQLGNRHARQLVPAWAVFPAIPGLKILDRKVEILIDLRGRHGFHPDIAFGQVIEKRTSIEAMVRNQHGIVISLRQEMRERGDQLNVQLQHYSLLGWSRDCRGSKPTYLAEKLGQ